jgi:serine/threonine protein phosphatase 1
VRDQAGRKRLAGLSACLRRERVRRKAMQTGITKNFDCKRLIAVGDVHGQIHLLRDLIENQIKFNPFNDVLIFLGDYIDRGKSSGEEFETMQYIQRLQTNWPERIVVLKGNHEDMAERAIGDFPEIEYMECWQNNGGVAWQWGDEHKKRLLEWIAQMPLYCLTDDFLFVHAGADSDLAIEKQSTHDLLWNRYSFDKHNGRRLVVGHTPTTSGLVSFGANRIVVDTGAFFRGILSAVDVLSGDVFQAERR